MSKPLNEIDIAKIAAEAAAAAVDRVLTARGIAPPQDAIGQAEAELEAVGKRMSLASVEGERRLKLSKHLTIVAPVGFEGAGEYLLGVRAEPSKAGGLRVTHVQYELDDPATLERIRSPYRTKWDDLVRQTLAGVARKPDGSPHTLPQDVEAHVTRETKPIVAQRRASVLRLVAGSMLADIVMRGVRVIGECSPNATVADAPAGWQKMPHRPELVPS